MRIIVKTTKYIFFKQYTPSYITNNDHKLWYIRIETTTDPQIIWAVGRETDAGNIMILSNIRVSQELQDQLETEYYSTI